MVTENISIDVRPGGVPVVIHVTQYEVGLRKFVFTPYTSNGTQTIVAGSATLEGTKPDGYAFQQACEMIDGVVTYTLQEQLCAVEGRVWSRLVIRDTDGGMIGYTAIVWVVGRAGVADDAVMSDSDISALQQFLDQFGEIDAYRGALNEAVAATRAQGESLRTEINERTTQDAVLSARMDSFSKLPDGSLSTAADAELADIRVKADGSTAATAGDAVREQVAELNSDLFVNVSDYLVYPGDWDQLTASSDASAWISDKLYKSGYIKQINVLVNGTEDQTVTIYLYKDNGDNTATKAAQYSISGHGLLSIPVNAYIDYNFYLSIKGKSVAFEKISSGIYKTGARATDTVDVSTLTNKYYHAYEIEYQSIYDTLNMMAYKSVVAYPDLLSAANGALGFASIIDLPVNHIFRTSNDLPDTFLLPVSGYYWTIIKFAPSLNTDTSTGYVAYLAYGLSGGGETIRTFYAQTTNSAATSGIVWKEIVSTDGLESKLNYTLQVYPTTITSSNYESLGFANILDLPVNYIYRFQNNLPESFHLPLVRRYCTLVKISPQSAIDTYLGFCIYLCGVTYGAQRDLYFAFSLQDQTADTLVWYRLNNPGNTKIPGLGTGSVKIAFIGDSIVEGYGSSDYNGGASGTSGHLIPNNVKTWYRNTGTKCWSNKMIAYLTEKYTGVTAVNNAIGGFTAEQLYNNLETLTVDDNGNLVNVVIVSVGTNDRNKSNKTTAIRDYIIKIVNWLKSHGITPIVIGNTPVIGATAPNNAETVQQYLIEGCENAGVLCHTMLPKVNEYLWLTNTPFEASTDQTKFMHDALHPADPGYEVMFQIIKKMLNV